VKEACTVYELPPQSCISKASITPISIRGYDFRMYHAYKGDSTCVTKDPNAPLHPISKRGLGVEAELLELGLRLETGSATDVSWPGQISSSRQYLL